MLVRRHAARAAVALFGALALAACGTGAGQSPGPTGTEVSVSISEPEYLIPTNVSDASGGQVLAALFTPLVTFDSNDKPVPDQAASITTTDSVVWTIHLKPGYTFHNGEAVTAQSYIDAWNYGAYAPNGQGNNYYYVHIKGYSDLNPANPKAKPTTTKMSGLKALDPLTLQVTLDAPYADFESELGFSCFLPMPKAAFAADGSIARGFEDAMVGDGPFEMKGVWNHDQSIEVTRYDAYPGPKPHISGVLFKVYDNLSVAYQDALAGDLDVLPNIATADLATAQADFSDRYLHSPSSAFQFLAFPTYDANYQNPDVRKAISMAIDRDQMVQTIFDNSQSAARSFVSPVLPGYRENTCGDACQYNPTAAKALYQAAHGPTKIQITYNADGGHQEWVEATCKQLSRNLGIACLPNPMPHFPDLLHAVQDKKPGVGMFRLGWIMDYPSMEDYLTPLYTTQGDYNYYGWSNSQFDQLVAEGSRQPSEDKAIGFYQQAENILATQLPVIPMRFGQNNTVISSRVGNVTVDTFGWVDLQTITVNGA